MPLRGRLFPFAPVDGWPHFSKLSDSDNVADRPTNNNPGEGILAGGNAQGTLEELLPCAEAFDSSASPSGDAEEWFRAESESLLRWAHERGRFLSPSQFRCLIGGLRQLEGGNEHVVFYHKSTGRVLKVTKPPPFGHMWELSGYVRNLILCNEFFEDDFRLEGITETQEGVSLVVSQPYVKGDSPSEQEIAEWFVLQACTAPWRISLGISKWDDSERDAHG